MDASRLGRVAGYALVIALLLLHAGRSARARVAATEVHTNIVAGALSARHPSAGALLVGDDPNTAVSWCSGVLIGCRTFLTAAHCVCQGDGQSCQEPNAPSPRSRIVYLQHAGFFRVASIVVHPDYRFPSADVAVLRLMTPVTAIAPTPLAADAPPPGTVATIVGFGRSNGEANDFGLKRAGDVTTSACSGGLSDDDEVCWSYDGTGADSCDGDSGGPLLVPLATGTAVAGLTSGGSNGCTPGDLAFDSNVATYRPWIASVADDDLAADHCGGMPQVGRTGTSIVDFTGVLSETRPEVTYGLTVPEGTNELRVALNARDDGQTNFDLYVKANGLPTPTDYDCHASGPSQYAYCEIPFPASGTWNALVERTAGQGAYQLTSTLVGGAAPVCGNDARETGEQCDGADDSACPGVCRACRCLYQCSEGALVSHRARLGRRVLFKGLLYDRAGTYDGLDPRLAGLSITFDDGENSPLEIAIPPNDGGWTRASAARGVYVWGGANARAHGIAVRCKRLGNGDWQLRVTASTRTTFTGPASAN